nr:hypothetical protein CFP56_07810 [Quercus suber]
MVLNAGREGRGSLAQSRDGVCLALVGLSSSCTSGIALREVAINTQEAEIHKGNCWRGKSCDWSHDPEVLRAGAAYKKIQCSRWAEKGACSYRKKCLYLHEGFVSDKALRKGLGEQVYRLDFVNNSDQFVGDITPTRCRERGSYSRTVSEESLIVAPGSLPKLIQPSLPKTLREDVVEYAESARFQSTSSPYPFRFEPLFEAMRAVGEDTEFLSTSIVTGLNCLHRLLQCTSGRPTRKFRVDVEVVGRTIFMSRWEQNLSTLAHMSWTRGHGRGFEQACTETQEAGKDLSSFHRLVSYKLAGIDLLVQHEVDACRCTCKGTAWECDYSEPLTSSVQPAEQAPPNRNVPTPIEASTLRVIKAGTKHSTNCFVEIKSRASGNTDLDDILGQLWLSRCHNLVLGYHQRGTFSPNDVKEEDMTLQLQQWQQDHADSISSLVKVLRQLKTIITDAQNSDMSSKFALLYSPGKDRNGLCLYSRLNGQEMLPKDLRSVLEAQESPSNNN